MSIVDPIVAAGKYEHGTRARYVLAKCRCFKCKVAHSDYVHEMTAAKRNPWQVHYSPPIRQYVVRNSETGEIRLRTAMRDVAMRLRASLNKKVPSECAGEWINAKPARTHIIRLQAEGVGYKTIAKRAGVSSTTVFEILKQNVTRSKRSTVEAILGVAGGPIGSVTIDAASTWVLLDALLAAGFRKAWIAREMGSKTPALQIRKDRCTAFTAARVRALYDRLWATDPRFRRSVDPKGEEIRAAAKDIAPAKAPLSKRDPAIAARWDNLFRESGAAL